MLLGLITRHIRQATRQYIDITFERRRKFDAFHFGKANASCQQSIDHGAIVGTPEPFNNTGGCDWPDIIYLNKRFFIGRHQRIERTKVLGQCRTPSLADFPNTQGEDKTSQ